MVGTDSRLRCEEEHREGNQGRINARGEDCGQRVEVVGTDISCVVETEKEASHTPSVMRYTSFRESVYKDTKKQRQVQSYKQGSTGKGCTASRTTQAGAQKNHGG